jgi:glucose-6-phosphate 1-dehydrogenase
METRHAKTTIIRRSDLKGQERTSDSQAPRAKDPFTLVIFGASGDLARRKLIPALYHLQDDKFLPDRYAVVGFSRTPMSDDAYRQKMTEALTETLGADGGKNPAESPLVKSLYYHAGDVDKPESYAQLKQRLEELDKKLNLPGNRMFYLSVSPSFFPVIIKQLGAAGLVSPRNAPTWTRVIIEKPFGRDLQSAHALNDDITEVLDESQIFRIDHYLGKETVQNILGFRFGNSIFEPLFNQKYVDHVQITVAETLGMEGKRGAYYDTAGATRDMVQNHIMQLLTLVAMEPPPALDGNSIRDAKVMLLRSLVPYTPEDALTSTVRGQYGAGIGGRGSGDGAKDDGKPIKAYREEEGVKPDSLTETFVALKIKIDNWRWAGVPFFLRTGKRLPARLSEIAITFKAPPMKLFASNKDSDYCLQSGPPKPNQLVLRIQPHEGLSLSVACKEPGLRMVLDEVDMDFLYEQRFKQRSPEAYERLLLDALRGDASLFTRSDEVYEAWKFVTSMQQAWAKLPPPKFPNYAPFTDGPAEASRLFAGTGSCWRPIRVADASGAPLAPEPQEKKAT